jgi:hypothetical protein
MRRESEMLATDSVSAGELYFVPTQTAFDKRPLLKMLSRGMSFEKAEASKMFCYTRKIWVQFLPTKSTYILFIM